MFVDWRTGVAGAWVASPACEAVTLHVPAPMIVTVVPRTLHAPLPAKETGNPELLAALTWNEGSPYFKPVGSGPNEIVCAAMLLLMRKLCITSGAGKKPALPAWYAVTMQ